jgi:transposase-like protein
MRTEEYRQALIRAIALREGTVKELAIRFGLAPELVRAFAEVNMDEIKEYAEPSPPDAVTPQQLDDLWITNKFERLKRLQNVADETYKTITDGVESTAELAIVIREFRSYLMLAANELGQLLHRGSGESGTGDSLSVEMNGVDMGDLQ